MRVIVVLAVFIVVSCGAPSDGFVEPDSGAGGGMIIGSGGGASGGATGGGLITGSGGGSGSSGGSTGGGASGGVTAVAGGVATTDAGFDGGSSGGAAGGSTVPDAGAGDAGVRPTRPRTDGGFTTQTTSYASGGSHAIDLYLPAGPGPFPVILYVHGGAWLEGDRSEATPLARREAARGFVVASIDYRLSQTARWPAQLHDVKAAVRWLRANAAQYRIDPSRIAAWGASAGAHLAAMLGTSANVTTLEDLNLGNPTQSSRVQSVIDWYGPTDFLRMDAQTVSGCANANHDGANSPESKLVGCTIQTCPATVATASPMTYVDPTDPPFLIMHGTRDCTVPTGQSRILDSALRSANVDSTLVEVQNLGHDFDGMRNSTTRMTQLEAFLDRVLYP